MRVLGTKLPWPSSPKRGSKQHNAEEAWENAEEEPARRSSLKRNSTGTLVDRSSEVEPCDGLGERTSTAASTLLMLQETPILQQFRYPRWALAP